MTIRQFFSNLFEYRVKEGEGGWEEATRNLAYSGKWSLSSSPKHFETLILEMLKRIERLEDEKTVQPNA